MRNQHTIIGTGQTTLLNTQIRMIFKRTNNNNNNNNNNEK